MATRAPAIALVSVVVLGGCGQSAVTSSAHESPSPGAQSFAEVESRSAAPSDHGDARDWSEAASFAGEALAVTGLVHGPAGYVAIGKDRDDATQVPLGRVWLSSDGSTWELLPPSDVFDRASLTHVVVARDGRYVAFGGIEDEASLAIWESVDGQSWRRSKVGLPPQLATAQVVAGDKGYLLAGLDFGLQRYELWLSADARSWEVVLELPSFSEALHEDIQSIAAGPEGFAANGIRNFGQYVIASGDGREWLEAAPTLGLNHRWLIAPLAGDWIMAGAVDDLPGVAVWFSPDGLDWREGVATLGDDSAAFPEMNSLVSTGAWVFAQLIIPGDAPGVADVPAGVWSSSDGTTWDEVDAVSDVFLAGAASSEDTMVLAGDGPEGAVFFLRPINQ